MKSYAKIAIGDPRKGIKEDFAYEKEKSGKLIERGGEALSSIGKIPGKV